MASDKKDFSSREQPSAPLYPTQATAHQESNVIFLNKSS